MKIVIALLFALTAQSVFAVGGTLDGTGAVKSQNKEYVPVVNGASAALTAGEAVCADLGESAGDNGIHVDYCTASGVSIGLIVDTSCAVGARCKVQTKGVFEAGVLDVTRGNAVAGDPAFVHTDGSLYGDTTPADNIQHVGVFLDSSSASGTIQVFLVK